MDAGAREGEVYTLEGGFWHGVSLVQTPGAPALKIQLVNDGRVIISWPVEIAGYELEQSSALGTKWVSTLTPVVDTTTEHTVSVAAGGPIRCYRLKKTQP